MMGYKTPNIDRLAHEGGSFTDYYGPIELSKYQKFEWIKDNLANEGIHLSPPTGN